jgi:uncharacterized membrane protein
MALLLLEVSLFIHTTAAVVGLGSTFALAVMTPVAMGMDVRNLPYVYRMQSTIDRYFANPALLLILVTGLYQVNEAGWSFGSFWISASLLIVIVLGGLVGGYFLPTDQKLEAMVTEEIKAASDRPVELSEEFLAKSKIEGMVGSLTGFLAIVAIFLMVVKPGA